MDVRLPDGTIITNVPEGTTQSELMRRVGLMAQPAAAPVKDAGFSFGDIAKSFGLGAVGSTKALTDVAGAENVVSSKLGDVSKSIQQSLTPERQAEMERQAARMKAAEDSGSFLQEIKAGALNVAEAPLQSAAQAIGSFVPYLPALFAAPAAAAMRLSAGSQAAVRAAAQQAPKVIGTAQSAGAVKGSIYDGVLRAEIEAGVDPEVAKQKADAAQSYFGGNFDQIAIGAGLGLAAGSTGVEKFLTPAGRAGAAPGAARRVLGATVTESLPEAAQGGQERVAQNVALQRAGYDVDTFAGAAGAATQEALTGALGAAPIAAISGPGAKPAAPAATPPATTPSPTQAIEDQAADLESQQQRQQAAMERARAGGIGGGSEVNQTLLEQARIRKEQQERAAAAEEKAAEVERQKTLRAERVRIGSTQYSGDPMMNEVLRSRAIADFDAANAPKPEAPKPAPEYQPTKTIEETTPIEQPEGVNVLRGLDYRDADFRTAMAERRAAEEAAAATQTKQAEAQKVEQAAKTDASRADVDLRVAQVENYLMSPAKKTQQETADYMAGVVPEMQKDFMALFDEDMNQPLTPEQTEALKAQIRQRLQPDFIPDENVQRTPFKRFLSAKGMNKKDVQDIFGENAYRANQQLPGAIKADGPRLDMLAEAAVEAGFLQNEDTEALVDMIKAEFGGDEQVSVDMSGDRAAAEYEAQRESELESRAAAIGLKTKGMTPDQVAARLDRIERKREEKRRQYSRNVDGFADLPTVEQDRIIDMMIDQFGEPQVFDVERAEIEGRVREEEELLQTQTEQQLRDKQAEIDRLEKENERLSKEADRKAKADEQVGDFVLTGSDRVADKAAARGQMDLTESEEPTRDEILKGVKALAEKLLNKGTVKYEDTELDGKVYQVKTRTFEGKLFGSELRTVRDALGNATEATLANEEDQVMTLSLTGRNVGEGANVRVMDSRYVEQEALADYDTAELRLAQGEEFGSSLDAVLIQEKDSYGYAALKKKSLTDKYARMADAVYDAIDAANKSFAKKDFDSFKRYEELFPKTAKQLKEYIGKSEATDIRKQAATGSGYNISAEDQRIEKELTGKSMIQAADWAVANAPNAFAKLIAEKTRNRLREFQRKGMTLEFNISGGSTRPRMLSGARGVTQFEWGKDDKGTKITVTLNGAAAMDNQAGYPPGVQYNTILHELLHVATRSQFVFMPSTDPLKKQMTELFNAVVGRFNADAKAGTLPPVMEKYYKRMNNVLEDPDELLAWGLTDKDVQAYFDDIKVGEKSVFTRLVELIRTALGLGKPYESALERLVRTSESMLDVDVDAIDAMLGQRDKQIGVKKKPAGPMTQESLFQKEGAPAKAPPTDSAAFKKWFGDSKVVDENGEPLVVYHGTFVRPMRGEEMMGDIKAFDRMFSTKFRRPSIDTVGSWFSTNPGDGGAEMYSGADAGSVIYPAYLSIKNPQVTTFQLMASRARKLQNGKDDGRQIGAQEVEAYRTWLKSMGKDGIKIEGSGNEGSTEFDNQVAWIALEPTQIKSATGNIGTYDPENADIRYQREAKSNPNQAAQANLDILDATGMQLQPPEPGRIESIKKALKAAGEDPALTKSSAKAAIKKFLDKMEVAAFSGDAAFNNDIRRNLEADFADNPEVLGMLLQASQSQAVHADALATQFIVDGGIAFDPETKKWVSIKKENNFIKLAKQIEKAAEKYGLNKEQTEQVAHTYFVAKRFKDLLKKQNARDAEIERLQAELEAENANIKQYKKDGDFEKLRTSERAKNDIKADIAKLEKAKVLISEDQRAMIEPGLSLVKNMPELEDISDTWQGIRANAVKAMIDGNLWSMKYAEDMLDNAAYVPFYRDEQLDEGGGPQEFIKGLQVKAEEFRLKGSNAAVNDVFDNMVRWTQYAINRSVRNHKALQMVDLGTDLKVGDRMMAEKVKEMDPKKNTIRVFRDGTQEIYSMADPLYVDAFSAISNVTIPSLKFFTWFSNALRQSVVLYPLFSVAQVPQDAISAMFTSGLKSRYALRIPVLAVKEFIKTLNKTSSTHNLLKSYGATGVRDFNATVARNDIQIAAGLKGAKSLGGKAFEMLSHVAMAADNSIRQAVYEASMQQGLSKGEAVEKAFDIINFRRRGTSKLVNLAGQTVPFFYAYMSVQRTAYKVLTGVGISPQTRKEALTTLATTSGAVMALSLFYVMMNGGDEEYEKTPTAIRDRTLNIPGTGGLRIPLRPDLFLMPKVLTEHLYHLITDTGLSDGAKFRKSVADGIANAVLSPQPIPQAVKPALEVAINYDFFQGRPLIGQFEKKKEAERQFNDNTSEFSKMLGQFGVSPIAADHMIRGMFGSAGGLFLYTTNFMINSDPDVPRPELSWRDAAAALPGTSGFVTKAGENALKTDFYALRDEVEKVKNTYNDIKTRSPQELDQFLSDEKNIARLGLAKGTEKIGLQLSKIRRAINQITSAPEDLYSASEKKDAIKELREVEKEMLKSVDIPAMRKMAMM